jgi:hypothetical protein
VSELNLLVVVVVFGDSGWFNLKVIEKIRVCSGTFQSSLDTRLARPSGAFTVLQPENWNSSFRLVRPGPRGQAVTKVQVTRSTQGCGPGSQLHWHAAYRGCRWGQPRELPPQPEPEHPGRDWHRPLALWHTQAARSILR